MDDAWSLGVVFDLERALRLVRDDHLGVVRHRRLALGAAEGPPTLPAPVKQEGNRIIESFFTANGVSTVTIYNHSKGELEHNLQNI